MQEQNVYTLPTFLGSRLASDLAQDLHGLTGRHDLATGILALAGTVFARQASTGSVWQGTLMVGDSATVVTGLSLTLTGQGVVRLEAIGSWDVSISLALLEAKK